VILPLVREHYGYDPDGWGALPWHWQRMYVEGLEAKGILSREDPDEAAQEAGIGHREVSTGDGVIDLNAMRAELAGGR
jgi:hypothetical protein